ncbi:COP23 domain-containing protein [Merismopedia glauca]|uniref:Uncharacterized protein n=1 Tax=Merismopedia glauca CCAP 1448/3 TaxID=1296344 RepID=A0A2T1C273_9CYAN|nr:COP23 domain-containing protein [Merismopedia glauca]PSB02342.1 hypothetical protein C7B64_13695 [Merismopedia glauca CCAP 1448/3]
MKITSISPLLAGCTLGAIALSLSIIPAQASEDVQFICASGYDRQTNKRFPTTFALSSQKKVAVIRWKYPWFHHDLSSLERCQQVSARFQSAYNNSSLAFITNSKNNGQKVICTSYRRGGACSVVLLTLRPSDDAIEVLSILKDALRGRGTQPLMHSSGEVQVYYQIDLKKFLEMAPSES